MKQIVKKVVSNFKEYPIWILAFCIVKFTKRSSSNDILLVPPADLDGSFGDDLMVASFVANLSSNRKVTIFTDFVYERPDYLKSDNITYLGGFKEKNYLFFINVLKKHSEIFVIGADVMDGSYGYLGVMRYYRLLKLGNQLGMKSNFSGFSVSKQIDERIKSELADVSKFSVIKARDIDSYNRLSKFIHKDQLMLTSDMAFLCPKLNIVTAEFENYKNWCKSSQGNGEMIIGVCTNSIQAKRMGLEKYLKEQYLLLKNFQNFKKVSYVFFYHDIRPLCGNETDKTISFTLYNTFKKEGVNCFFPDQIQNGPSLKNYLDFIDFTVSGRMHMAISGLTAFKPMYGIGYADKFEGMLRLFDIDPTYCLTDYRNMMNSSETMNLFFKHFEEIKEKIKKNIDEIKSKSQRNIERL